MRDLLARVAGSGAKPAAGNVRRDLGGAALAFAAAAVLGNWVEEFTAFEWSLWAVQAILALSLTLVWGYGGIFSLGQAAIYGIGGYTYGFWAINLADNTGESLTAVPVAVVVGAVFAALLGYFMFYGNVTDVYVAIITLATSLVLFAFVNSTSGRAYRIGDAPFGGYNGMPRIPRITWRLPGGESHELTRTQFFLFCVAAGLLIAVAIRVLSRRPFGRIAVALQHNELRTGLLGYDVRWHKLAVFTIGGAIAAFAGALFAAWGRFMSPPVFSLTPAALVVIWVLVGGRSSVSGAFVGVLVVKGFSSWFGGASGDNEPIVLGVILVLIVLLLPGGIVANLSKLRRWAQSRISLSTTRLGSDAEAVGHGPEPHPVTPTQVAQHRARLIATAAVTKRYGGLAAVDAVTLEFPRGVSCLIGPNGAGKSTLLDLLSGRRRPTTGAVMLDGQDLTKREPFLRARGGVGTKLQVASVYESLTVRENLWLACYAMPRDIEEADRRAAELLEWLALGDEADQAAGTLSHGKKQWLEIGMVVSTDPSVVLLDEPTAGMTREETERTASLVRELGERASVIVVEHDMDFVRQLDAPITVLHMGSMFTQGTFEELSGDDRVIDIYLGAHHSNGSPADGRGPAPGGPQTPAVRRPTARSPLEDRLMLTLRGLRAGYGDTPVLHGIDLKLAPSECAAVLGRNGVGKTTLMRAITGAISTTGGSIQFDGNDLGPLKAHERARLGISHVPQGREIFPKLTVLENLRVGTAARRNRRSDAVDRIFEEFPMLAQRRRARGGSLSGGQQQLLALARALVAAPRLLLLDEPSEGIQPSVLDEIAEVIGRINAERGIAVLAVEQNLEFAARIARRSLILEKGEIIAEVATAELRGDRALQRKYLAL